MPAFVPHVTVDLHKLLQNSAIAASALRGEASRVVIMAIDIAFVLVIRVLRPKERRTHRTGEVVHMELLVCGRGVIRTRSWPALAPSHVLHAVM